MTEIIQTELQSRLETLYTRELLMEKAEELANAGSWSLDVLSGKMEWSQQMFRIFGYTSVNFEPSPELFLNHIHPDDVPLIKSLLNEAGNNVDFKKSDYRIIDETGTIKYMTATHLSEQGETGEVIKITGLVKDITRVKILELRLNESQALYQAIIGNSVNAFFLANKNGEILETNEAACEMFGYTHDELTKLERHQILEDNDPQFVMALQRRQSTRRMKGEVAGIKKNGERMLLEFTSARFLNANNEERVIALMADITSRKQQEEVLLKSNERFEHVSKATFDAIWDWDVKSKQLYFGDGFKELFGHEIENNTGDFSTWYNHIHPEDRERVMLSRLNKIIHNTESTWKDEYRYIRADGTIAYISDRGILLRNSIGTYRMIGAMQDVTELKENEIAISNLNKSLEKRAEELDVSNQELERFAYVASHDLQEPLRMVASFLQLLQKRYDHQLDETAQKYISFAVDGADRMKTLILDLLEYSRISSSKENHTMIDLNDLISQTLLVLKPLIDDSEATITVSTLPEICGNTSQLMRLFQNLISNALKYRSTLTPIIEIGYSQSEDEWEFFVKDNGIGISPKYFEKIFIIFQRLHGKAEYGGTGIGLAICKKIVELHGGKIWVESALKAGSKFYFTISKFTILNCIDPQMADTCASKN
ncbi:MAG: PAS domain-containing protein [Ferruginibacter sp.]